MAFANPTAAFTGVSGDLDNFIKEIWSPIIHDWKGAQMTIMNFAQDLSYLLTDGGDVINVPNIYTNIFTVSTQSTEGNGVVDQSPASGNVTLTVNTHKYIAFVIGKKTMKQVASQYPLSRKYAEQARELLIQALETDLFALVSSLSTTDVGDGTAAITDLVVRQAINALQSTNGTVFELSKMAFFFHPTVYWTQLLGISKYYERQKSNMNVVRDGNFGAAVTSESFKGELYGIPVFISSLVPVAATVVSNMLLHEDAFGFGMHTDGVDVTTTYENRNIAWLTVCDIIYGVAALRAAAGVTILADEAETVNA